MKAVVSHQIKETKSTVVTDLKTIEDLALDHMNRLYFLGIMLDNVTDDTCQLNPPFFYGLAAILKESSDKLSDILELVYNLKRQEEQGKE